MSYRLKIANDVRSEIPRVAHEQLKRALGEIDDVNLDLHEKIHQVRKRLKKIRAVLRLVRPALGDRYAPQNAFYRDLGRELSGLRDAQAKIKTIESLSNVAVDEFQGPLIELRDKLAQERDRRVENGGEASEKLAAVSRKLESAKAEVKSWEFDTGGFKLTADGLRNSYGRGRKALARAYETGSAEDFHDLRKRVKYHWYHVRLLGECWDKPMQARQDELHELAGLLGEDHDLVVIEQALREGGGLDHKDFRRLLKLLRRRSKEIRGASRPLAERVFAEKPKRLGKRIKRYWRSHESALRETRTLQELVTR